jgi:thiol-disulfide isomerase/thioredoxin
MKAMRSLRFAVLAVLLSQLCAFAGTPAGAQSDFSLPDLQQQQHSLAEYKGKIVVVNFWATWCVPCKHEMPLFVDAVKHYGDRVQVVAVSLDDASTRAKIPAFSEKQKMTFPVLLGNTTTMQTLGLGEAVPATVFLDASGKVIFRVLGEVSKSELRARLDFLLGLKSGDTPPELVNNLNKKREEDLTPLMH